MRLRLHHASESTQIDLPYRSNDTQCQSVSFFAHFEAGTGTQSEPTTHRRRQDDLPLGRNKYRSHGYHRCFAE